MDQLKRNMPILVIFLAALVLTGVAGYQHNTDLLTKDLWGIPFWLTPLGYLGLAALFGGLSGLNNWTAATVTMMVFALAGVLLFAPLPGLQWHFVIGAAALVYVFLF